MVRGLILGSAVAATALATASFPAFAYGCRNGRSTDPNCYREYGYVCGPCYNDWGGEGWRRYDGWRGGWGRRHRDRGDYGYGCDRYGRSTDPNCYRREGYVCGPCYQ
jgi:hypothetical protein